MWFRPRVGWAKVRASRANHHRATPQVGHHNPGNPLKILVAEDDSVSRFMTVKALEQLGYACTSATDGQDAWDKFIRDGADVVISDWMMPRVDGIELCRRVRAREDRGYTYFIVLTALAEREFRLTGMRAGADDYLAKPLDREELLLRLIAAERVTKLHRKLEDQAQQLERLNREFFEVGRKDPLTGIGNRRRMQEDLSAFEAEFLRGGLPVAVALFDIDNFKPYNDHYLHVAGDEVLRKVASTLSRTLSAEDSIYRYGGEEFLAVLPGLDLDQAMARVERMRAAIEACAIPHDLTERRVITVSAGVAPVAAQAGESIFLAAIRRADEALLRAKREGKNRVVRAPTGSS